MLKLNGDNFEEEVLNSDQPVLVDFWAPWCGPCQVLGPVIEELAEEIEGAKIGKLNVDESQQIAGKYQIQGIPTVVLFKNGEPKERLVGVRSKDEYKQAIENNK
jgi:thioredoxin 1